MSRIKERPGFLSPCLPSFPFHAPPSDNAGVQSNRVVVRPQAWQRSSRSCGSWPAATRRPDPRSKGRVVHYVQKAQGGSEPPVHRKAHIGFLDRDVLRLWPVRSQWEGGNSLVLD